ncbi:MAG: hemolysin family protein [Bacteroidota bacterium]
MTFDPGDIFLLILMIILSGLFSGIEIAFVSSSRLKIELKNAQGDKTGMILSRFVKRTPRVITTILVGNNLALVLYGIVVARVLNYAFVAGGVIDPLASPYTALVLQTVISTLIILIFGEYLPKALFRLNAEKIMFHTFTARTLLFFYYLFGPFVIFVNQASHFFLKRILRLRYEEEAVSFSKEDLNLYLQETLSASGESEDIPEIDAEMFTNAMEFNEIRVREFMVPRTEIEALPSDCSIDALIDKFIETGHSKILIYGENLDEILGFVHSSALFTRPKQMREVLQPVLHVPESMAGNVLLNEFTKNRSTLALVVDEFGGTAGIVTVEDLVEEVFGEIEDEHDEQQEEEALLEKQIDANTWLLSARHEVDYLNEQYQIDLPEGEYNTLGGLVIHYAEAIPATNETVSIDDFQLAIVDASDNKVNTVRVHRLPRE